MNNPPLFAGGGSDLFDIVTHMHGLDRFEEEAKQAVRIRLERVELLVLPLERIIASKKATGHPKDKAILPILEDTLRTLSDRNSEPD